MTTLRPDLVSPEVDAGPEGPGRGARPGRVRGPRLPRGLRPRAVRPRLSPGHRPPACRLVRHGRPRGPRRHVDRTGRHRDDRAAGPDRDAEPDGAGPGRRDLHRRLQAHARRLPHVRPGPGRPRQPLRLRRERRRPEQAPAGARHGRGLRRRPGRPPDVDRAGRRSPPPDSPRAPERRRRSWSADPGSQRTVPGSRVRDWGAGNWSGSADKKLRTLRAGPLPPGVAGEAVPRSTATSRAPRPPRWRACSRPAGAATRCSWT